MLRVLVMGCSGSGSTTSRRQRVDELNLPFAPVDRIR